MTVFEAAWRCGRGVLAIAALLAAVAVEARADDLEDAVTKLGGKPCADSSLTCVDITVPYDRSAPDSDRRLSIHFAISFASEESKGILFYAVGGPGGSGTALAQSYMDGFDERLQKDMDVVFFDQRGTGTANGIDCPKASLAFDLAPISLDAPDAAVSAAKGFVSACLAEMTHRDLLPFLSTEDAIADLEAFRRKVGAPKVWLYGESYGTQFAQQYAAHYPAAVKGLILDGVVDLTRDAAQYYAEDVRTAEALLARTFAACDAAPNCAKDMGGAAAEVYDRLAAKLQAAPIDVDFPLGSGGSGQRQLTAAILEADAFYALYGPDSRMSFLRALAASAHGNLVPLLRLGYQNLEADPDTLEPANDPTMYPGAYYAITCPDYEDAGGDPEAHAKAILDEARALAPKAPRLTRDLFAERLACAFWPTRGTATRPEPFPGGDYPTLVLNSDSDPATPISNGDAVFDHARNDYMVTMEGGPHVIWGRGHACPDEIVFGLMLDGRKPEKREQLCRESFIGRYEPLSQVDGSDAFDLVRSVETEIAQSPELSNWDGSDPLSVGCDYGGALTASAAESGTGYSFKDCAWWKGIALSGDGVSIDAGDGSKPDGLTLTLVVTGTHRGTLFYRHDTTTDAMSLSGTYDGAEVSTPRPLP